MNNLDKYQKKALEMALNDKEQMIYIDGEAGCVDKKTEYFNGKEWIKISNYKKGDKVLQYNKDETANLVEPIGYISKPVMGWWNYKNRYIDMKLSKEHNFIYLSRRLNLMNMNISEFALRHNKTQSGSTVYVINGFIYQNKKNNDYTNKQLRQLVAICADGSISGLAKNTVRFNIKKQRKINRFKKLFDIYNIEKYIKKDGYIKINLKMNYDITKFLSDFIYDLNQEQLKIVSDELVHWDGSKTGRKKNVDSISTTWKKEADAIQFVYSATNNRSYIGIDKRIYKISKENGYSVSKHNKNKTSLLQKSFRKSNFNWEFIKTKDKEKKYCFTVPSGMLVLRRNNKIFITGNSGKSETIKVIKTQLKSRGWKVSLTAPTGKASKRIGGTTIHRWLEPEVEEDRWMNPKIIGWNKESFSNKECLIIDEASMLDNQIHERVMHVFNNSDWNKKKIIFVGDTSQLEPVQEGTPFIDFIQKNKDKGVTLEKIHRQKDGNDIVMFAHAIRHEKQITEKLNNVKQVSRQTAIEEVVEDSINNQIICPIKNGINGVNQLNKEIQIEIGNSEKLLNKHIFIRQENGRYKRIKDIGLFKGDKIVITKNHWGFNITNGTTGILTGIGHELVPGDYGMSKMIEVVYFIDDYDNKKYFLPLKWIETNIDLAYALTVHKFQGSQCKNIFFMLSDDQTYYLDKKMKYTGVTRAEEMLYLVM